jgi:hypothetical protein
MEKGMEEILNRIVRVKRSDGTYDGMKLWLVPKCSIIGIEKKIFKNLQKGEEIEKWVYKWLSQFYHIEEDPEKPEEWWRLSKK